MEDILAIALVLVVVGIFVFVVKRILKSRQQKAEQIAQREELMRQYKEEAKQRASARLNAAVSNTPPKKRTFVKREEPAPTYVPSATQSVQSSSFLSDAADIAMIAHTIHHWNDNSRSETVREERSVGVTKSESSWGFDDSDSRKSVSDTFGSSSSSDSWSSSSSDSGPSSDW